MATAPILIDKHLFEPLDKEEVDLNQRFIQSSPYREDSHLLDLQPYGYEHKIIALALQSFITVKENYATVLYAEGFNISEVIDLAFEYANDLGRPLGDFSVYIVAFRSKLFHEVQMSSQKREILGQIDKSSHAEANQSGGLLKYFFGVPDKDGNNLATCWWTNHNAAVKGGGGKAHREGVKLVRNWYEKWQIEQYRLDISNNSYKLLEI